MREEEPLIQKHMHTHTLMLTHTQFWAGVCLSLRNINIVSAVA